MPSPEESSLTQTAVLWESSGSADAYGQPTVIDPVEISVRWENTNTEVVGPQGNPVQISASVRVKQDVPVGSIMWLGTLDDLEDIPGTGGIPGLCEVVNRVHVPDIKNRKTSRVLQLAKYKDTLPTIV